MPKARLSKPKPVILERDVYCVDGGEVEAVDTVRIDLTAKGSSRTLSLTTSRDGAGFYPIGAEVRVTVERLK